MIITELPTLTIVDIIPYTQKSFQIRKIQLENDMSKNDFCFCGSGKKHNKCHPDIHPQSIIANLYKVHNQIDEELADFKSECCQKGCAECCSDFFNVSCAEFFYILQYLIDNGSDTLKEYSLKAQQLIERVHLPEDDNYNIEGFPPCIFLDNTSDSCTIYEVRPILCKMYGSYDKVTRCPKVLKSEQKLLANISCDIQSNIDFFKYKGSQLKPLLHPLLYWFAKANEDGTLNNPKLQTLYDLSLHRPINEFIQALTL